MLYAILDIIIIGGGCGIAIYLLYNMLRETLKKKISDILKCHKNGGKKNSFRHLTVCCQKCIQDQGCMPRSRGISVRLAIS